MNYKTPMAVLFNTKAISTLISSSKSPYRENVPPYKHNMLAAIPPLNMLKHIPS
jgi:hypothetical protein